MKHLQTNGGMKHESWKKDEWGFIWAFALDSRSWCPPWWDSSPHLSLVLIPWTTCWRAPYRRFSAVPLYYDRCGWGQLTHTRVSGWRSFWGWTIMCWSFLHPTRQRRVLVYSHVWNSHELNIRVKAKPGLSGSVSKGQQCHVRLISFWCLISSISRKAKRNDKSRWLGLNYSIITISFSRLKYISLLHLQNWRHEQQIGEA